MEYVITFKSTNLAIKAERCLLEQKLRVGVTPLPNQISAGCGICLRINQDEIKAALKALADNGVDGTSLYLRDSENGQFVYTELENGGF
jgi:hypothetical protein